MYHVPDANILSRGITVINHVPHDTLVRRSPTLEQMLTNLVLTRSSSIAMANVHHRCEAGTRTRILVKDTGRDSSAASRTFVRALPTVWIGPAPETWVGNWFGLAIVKST